MRQGGQSCTTTQEIQLSWQNQQLHIVWDNRMDYLSPLSTVKYIATYVSEIIHAVQLHLISYRLHGQTVYLSYGIQSEKDH